MREGKRGRLQTEGTNNGLMGDPAESDDRAQIRQGRDRRSEKGTAALNFRRHRLVLRRHAAHGIGDRARDKPQAVVHRRSVSARGKAEFDQHLIEKDAGEIAGKGPPRAVGAAQARREANHQQTRVKCSEIRNRRVVPFWLRCPKGIAKCCEARAKRTVRVRLAGEWALPGRRRDSLRAHRNRLRAERFYERSSASSGSKLPAGADRCGFCERSGRSMGSRPIVEAR